MDRTTAEVDLLSLAARLRALAEKATRGPWTRVRRTGPLDDVASAGESVYIAVSCKKRDAEYLAACDPQTILSLLDALARPVLTTEEAERRLTDEVLRKALWAYNTGWPKKTQGSEQLMREELLAALFPHDGSRT